MSSKIVRLPPTAKLLMMGCEISYSAHVSACAGITGFANSEKSKREKSLFFFMQNIVDNGLISELKSDLIPPFVNIASYLIYPLYNSKTLF